jgi:hypothetical protein
MQTTAHETSCSWSAFGRNALRFLALFLLLWLAFDAVHVGFPYIRNGASIIYSTKVDYVRSHRVFTSTARYRVAVVGDSRALAGFRPDDFDRQLVGKNVQSFNLALPGERDVLSILRAFLDGGNRPTHLLVANALPDQPAPNPVSMLRADRAINQFLFPFRDLPRDLVLFTFAAIQGRGILGQYRYGHEQADKMIEDRGWYFIAGQSHYPNNQLPADFALPSDRPAIVFRRSIHAESRAFGQLMALAKQYDFHVVLVPAFFRQGALAPAAGATSERPEPVGGADRVEQIGPDYILLAAPKFSDPVHPNPSGAQEYSQYLARLLETALR